MLVLTHDSLDKKDQVAFLKSKNVAIDVFDDIKGGVE